jgi:N-acetylglucosamine kinase-like BadF-type ATPase|tara:strand:+ start:1422 stop:1598 length:177 start_codon:yes stop_codon:yes gene_type:complete
MEKFEEIKALIEAVAEDVDKFYVKGNKAAAVRIRKTMQEVKNAAQELRVHVQETKNSL